MLVLLMTVKCPTAYSQNFGFNSALLSEGTDSNITNFSATYSEGRVYLNIMLQGLKEFRYYTVKRSQDGNNFLPIGNFKCLATPGNVEVLYSYTDNYPLYSFIYYRVIYYTAGNDSLYSKTLGVHAGTDKSNLYVTIDDDIWVINQKNEKMIPLKLDFNTREAERNACTSPDGKTIYFCSSRSGGYGGTDVWASEMLSNGQWNDPYNLGGEINSAQDEEMPVILEDGATIFFTRKNKQDTANRQAYFSTISDDGLWSDPENIELLQSQTKDYYSVITGSISGKKYYYHVRRIE